MTQRVGIVAFTCGLAASLASGCTQPQGCRDNQILVRESVKPPPDPPGSPYRTPVENKSGTAGMAPNPDAIRRTGYAKDNADRESPVRPGLVPDRPTDPGRLSPEVFPAAFIHASDPGPPEPIVEALRCLLAKRLRDAMVAIDHCDKSNQEALLLLLPWVARLGEGSLDQIKPQEMAAFLEQMEVYERTLRPRATLTLNKACFCQKVSGFGFYDPLPDGYAFQAGSDARLGERMVLYVEVGNFTSRPAGQFHETRLTAQVQIHDTHGQPVWSYIFETKPDASRSSRHDYFFTLYFSVPPHLTAGSYTLTLDVGDQTGQANPQTLPHRAARRTLHFDVTTDESASAPAKGIAVVPSGGG